MVGSLCVLPHITPVSLLEMQVSYTMFPELVINSLALYFCLVFVAANKEEVFS